MWFASLGTEHCNKTLGQKHKAQSHFHSLWKHLPSFPGISAVLTHEKGSEDAEGFTFQNFFYTTTLRSQQIPLHKSIYKHEVLSWQVLRAEGSAISRCPMS